MSNIEVNIDLSKINAERKVKTVYEVEFSGILDYELFVDTLIYDSLEKAEKQFQKILREEKARIEDEYENISEEDDEDIDYVFDTDNKSWFSGYKNGYSVDDSSNCKIIKKEVL